MSPLLASALDRAEEAVDGWQWHACASDWGGLVVGAPAGRLGEVDRVPQGCRRLAQSVAARPQAHARIVVVS